LLGTVRAALRPSQPASRVDIRDAFTVALAAAAELKPVFTRRQLREHRDRIGRLTECAGPIPHALRKVIRQTRSAVAAG
ncbi:MAG: GPP34 family phosphoprotein, partial [Kutzneria sp.]|nr:GPP34 family phosphoprotein [Kutzneria sp.]